MEMTPESPTFLSWSRLIAPFTRLGRSGHRTVYYHRVAANDVSYFESRVDPDVFEAQIGFLTRHFDVIPLTEAIRRARTGGSLEGTVSVTTDDGFVENHTLIAPILERYGASGTFFCVSSCTDNRWMMWRSQTQHLNRTVDPRTLKSAMKGVADVFGIRPPNDNESLASWTIGWEGATKDDQVQELWNRCDIEPMAQFLDRSKPYLTTDQLQDLVARGHTIGSHSATHPVCSGLPAEEFVVEVTRSCDELAELSGSPVRTFAYPFGERAQPDAEAALATAGRVDCLLGIRAKMDNRQDPMLWERDNLEFGAWRSQLEFTVKPLARRVRDAVS